MEFFNGTIRIKGGSARITNNVFVYSDESLGTIDVDFEKQLIVIDGLRLGRSALHIGRSRFRIVRAWRAVWLKIAKVCLRLAHGAGEVK